MSRGSAGTAPACALALLCLATAEPPPERRVHWMWGAAGDSCTAACDTRSMACGEGSWPLAAAAFWGAAPDAGTLCAEVLPGGFDDAPVLLEDGLCAWLGPQRLWNKGEYGLSSDRCARAPHALSRRLCPCELVARASGLAAWSDAAVPHEHDKWVARKTQGGLVAGIRRVKVAGTVLADSFELLVGGATGNTAQWAEFGEKVASNYTNFTGAAPFVLTASNDIATLVVQGDGSLKAWVTGQPYDLPYRDSVTGLYRAAPVYFEGYAELEPPDFGAVIPEPLASSFGLQVAAVAATRAAFAVLLRNGSVAVWGDPDSGGGGPSGELAGVAQLFATQGAFAALLLNGTVVSWGHPKLGGAGVPVPNVLSVVANAGAFAALTRNRTVVTWGSSYTGGEASQAYSIPTDPPWLTRMRCEGNWEGVTEVDACAAAARALGLPLGSPYGGELGAAGRRYDGEFSVSERRYPHGCLAARDGTEPGSRMRSVFFNANAAPASLCTHHQPLAPPARTRGEFVYPNMTISTCLDLFCNEDSRIAAKFLPEASQCTLYEAVVLAASAGASAEGDGGIFYLRSEDTAPVCKAVAASTQMVLATGPVQAIYATARSFLAVTQAGAVPFPHGGGTRVPPSFEAVAAEPPPSVVTSFDAFLLLWGNGTVETLWGLGSASGYWTESLAPVALLERDSSHAVVDVKTSRDAATVLWEDGKASTWRVRPPGIQQFWKVPNSACFWPEENEKFYEDFRLNTSREECAELCLDNPRCTGFEYPLKQMYCAPWLNGYCTNASMSTSTLGAQDLVDYETYFVRRYVIAPETDQPAFRFWGAGACPGTRSVSEVAASLVGCHERCAKPSASCLAYSYNAEDGTCELFSDIALAGSPLYTEETQETSCFVSNVLFRPSEPTANECERTRGAIGGIQLLFPDGTVADAVLSPAAPPACATFATAPDGMDGASIWSPNNASVAFRIKTSLLDPAFDPTRFKIAHTKTQEAQIDPVLVEVDRPHLTIPTARGAPSAWYYFKPTHIRIESHILVFIPDLPRGRVSYALREGANCTLEDDYVAGVNETRLVVLQGVLSLEACAAHCQTARHPSNCTVLAYPFELVPGHCGLYFDDTCVKTAAEQEEEGVDGGWDFAPGYTLYELSRWRVEEPDTPGTTNVHEFAGSVRGLVATFGGFAAVARPGNSSDEPDALWDTVITWNDTTPFSVPSPLAWGKPAYVQSGVQTLAAGTHTFALLRHGSSGHDECEVCPCHPFAFNPSQEASDDLCLTAGQACHDPAGSSEAYADFVCACYSSPVETVGKPAPCKKPEGIPLWPLFLLNLPVFCGFFYHIYLEKAKEREKNRQISGMCEMYLLGEANKNETALYLLLAINNGKEFTLLRTLVPDYDKRGTEITLFLLWQTRMHAMDSAKALPYELLKQAQLFTFGLELLRRPRAPPMTPLGYLSVQIAKLQRQIGERRRAQQLEKAEMMRSLSDLEGLPLNVIWTSDLSVPLMESDDADIIL
ncbi:hypothetical protein DIPPA_26491 [Diplonema papillatum]|nr:hypothetical protein DIPPA_26491 [Diplonema papillatum]